jgi:hypothetical protein
MKNLLTSGVAFENKPAKLPIVTNVTCCSCLFFYNFSPLSDNNNNNNKKIKIKFMRYGLL